MLGYMFDTPLNMGYKMCMPSQMEGVNKDLRAGKHPKTVMKSSIHHSKNLDPPKAQGPSIEEPPSATTSNMSRERLMEGESTTTTVLTRILQKENRPESRRHWGINE